MPYEIYAYGNVSMGVCRMQDAIDVINTTDDQQQFLDNIETWDCVSGKGMNNQMFDLIKYSSLYFKMDCKVLMDGYDVFRSWVLGHTELYVDNSITIQTMASTFMLKSGCYKNVYQISGALQQFSTKCVVGGRVATANNK